MRSFTSTFNKYNVICIYRLKNSIHKILSFVKPMTWIMEDLKYTSMRVTSNIHSTTNPSSHKLYCNTFCYYQYMINLYMTRQYDPSDPPETVYPLHT